MVTINDVAKYAGVSNATASRALRKIGSIRPSTILKVEKAAEELGFIINTTAQLAKNLPPATASVSSSRM
jgi:Transcriptional regulators